MSAWLNFYVMAATEPEARRLLTVYQGRLRSNLLHGLRPLAGSHAPAIAERLAGLIDGLYLRAALNPAASNASEATEHVLSTLACELEAAA